MTALPPSCSGAAQRCLQTLSHLIPLSSAVFYQVNALRMPHSYVLHDMPEKTHRQYLEQFQSEDPLLPQHFNSSSTTLAAMTPGRIARCRRYYHDFMLPNNVREMTELFIRRPGGIAAGICLMRDVPFSDEERRQITAVLPLIDLALGDSLHTGDAFAGLLTRKEREILTRVREGASNKAIARQMDISLSTVKTHLRHIFSKTEVANRTELASRCRGTL